MPRKNPARHNKNGLSRRRFIGVVGAFGTGTALLIGLHNSDAFTTGVTDRTPQVDIVSDQDGALRVIGTDADTTPEFTNNFSTTVTITLTAPSNPNAEFDVDNTGTFESPPVTFSLNPGQTRTVGITGDTSPVTVDINGEHGNGSVSLTRDFQLSEADQISVTANVVATGASGKFVFGLRNTGSIDAELIGIRIDSTSANAVEVSNGDIFSIDSSEDPNVTPRQLISSPLDIDSETASDLPITNFDGNDTVILRNTGDETQFEFDRFQTGGGPGNPNADMRGEIVNITLEFSDGSTDKYVLDDS